MEGNTNMPTNCINEGRPVYFSYSSNSTPSANFLLRHPFRNFPCLRGERNAYFEQLSSICGERQGIFLAVDLFKGFFCRFVEFKLKDVYVLRRFYYGVNPAVRGCALRFGVKAQQFENQICNVLKI